MGLLDLPREIRDHILCYALTRERTKLARWRSIKDSQDPYMHYMIAYRDAKQLPATKVCRQLRQEALPLFYSINTFAASRGALGAIDTMQEWLHAIGDSNVQHIRRLELQADFIWPDVIARSDPERNLFGRFAVTFDLHSVAATSVVRLWPEWPLNTEMQRVCQERFDAMVNDAAGPQRHYGSAEAKTLVERFLEESYR